MGGECKQLFTFLALGLTSETAFLRNLRLWLPEWKTALVFPEKNVIIGQARAESWTYCGNRQDANNS